MRINSNNQQNFQGVRLKSQSFERFREYALKTNFLEKYSRLINPENYINEGLKNKVYRIPDNPDFLLRVRKVPAPKQDLGFRPVEDAFPTLNVGQEIARLDDDVTVVITQKGEPCGIRHFVGQKIVSIQPEDKTQFIKYISTIADFPYNAYHKFVEEVRIVNGFKLFDVHNPQNILYDAEKQCFNLVDVSPKDKLIQMLSPIALAEQLCDFKNLFNVLKMSDSKEQQIVLNSVASIVKNVKLSAKNNGLKPSIIPYVHKFYNFIRGRKQDELVTFLKFRALYMNSTRK